MTKNNESNYSTPSLSSLCLTRESINNEFNLNGFSGRTPVGVCHRMTGMEYGRSLVEMLGTLAIIGVLSGKSITHPLCIAKPLCTEGLQ